jgi:hypothetical protein
MSRRGLHLALKCSDREQPLPESLSDANAHSPAPARTETVLVELRNTTAQPSLNLRNGNVQPCKEEVGNMPTSLKTGLLRAIRLVIYAN